MSQRLKRWSLPVEGRNLEEDCKIATTQKKQTQMLRQGLRGGEEVRAVASDENSKDRGEKLILPLILFCDRHHACYIA